MPPDGAGALPGVGRDARPDRVGGQPEAEHGDAGHEERRDRDRCLPLLCDLGVYRLVSALSLTTSTGRPGAGTIQLYERGPAVKLGTSHLISTQVGLTDPRIVDGIEQRSSLYGLLLEGQGCMGGCAGGPIRCRVVMRPG
jgi:hypothetical protein